MDSSTSFSQMPPDLIARILVHVSETDRLKHCALVCKSWAAAAAAATTTVQLSQAGEDRGHKLRSLRSWLLTYHHHVTSLKVSTVKGKPMALRVMPAMNFTVLPCNNLRQLDLQQLKLELPVRGTTASLQGFSQLTKLALTSCYIPWAAVLLPPPLQELMIGRGLWGPSGSLVGSFLESTALQGLTRLTLHDDSTGGLMANALQHLDSCSSVRRLSLVCPPQTRSASAPALTAEVLSGSMHALQHLTSLSLSHIGVTEIEVPCMMQLTALQRLKLVECPGMPANVLASFTRLQHLHLDTFHNVPCPELLATLAGHTQLTYLAIGPVERSAPAEAFHALTASSKLAHLNLNNVKSPLLWDHVLPSGLHLPDLTRLEVQFCSPVPLQVCLWGVSIKFLCSAVAAQLIHTSASTQKCIAQVWLLPSTVSAETAARRIVKLHCAPRGGCSSTLLQTVRAETANCRSLGHDCHWCLSS